jgi:4-amino-4-deoxy-L-arabinose transferase-like glycosyltransferase
MMVSLKSDNQKIQRQATNSRSDRKKAYGVYIEPAALFVFGLAVRFSILPYWKNLPLSGDELHYWNWARVAAEGHLINNYLHPPLWTYLLGIGAFISDNPLYGRMIAAVVSSFSIVVIYLLGKRLFGRKVGLIAGIVYSIYPNLVGFSHYLWSENLLACLVLLGTFFLFGPTGKNGEFRRPYISCLVLGFGLLVKEFALVAFVAAIYSMAATPMTDKWKTVRRCILIFLAPAVLYSCLASFRADRPVILADAFAFNSNEADAGKIVWKSSTKENMKVFAGRLLKIQKAPQRLVSNVANLWTPASFPIFRLISSNEGYRNVPHARAIAYIAAIMYVVIVTSGLIGMCFARNQAFLKYAAANLFVLTSMGLMFLMCSRFRIPFMHIFILYGAVACTDIRGMAERRSWLRGLILAILLTVFAIVLVSKHTSFGAWG